MIAIVWIVLSAVWLSACTQFQPTAPAVQAKDYTPTGILQSVTMKDSSVHYDAAVLKLGTPRSQVQTAFGDPNASETTSSGQLEDIYAFNPDGSKFVDPKIRPRNIALGVLTMGSSVAVRQARLKLAESKLTLYRIYYAPDQTIASVVQEKMSNAAADTPGAKSESSGSSNQ
ncbi:MAG TPA: hypothetical protein VKV28_16345 [Candidatus Binataceae bacterium]|nr:hypothetical protein [Candidatus Binataceae bacterium]